ncbi:hypothetical protein [Flavicella sp.]|uniref:hypothetical protein n=1 Tax=Flavicella sp. TaxID=2957742 RepID=UPI00262EE149|nr:hypothetical protein [Flavicella sp.]MDG1804542.1 hypothetical protein [Flavicella sp.]MDG2280476.1 hypothetical protein [Flavicella sp.]
MNNPTQHQTIQTEWTPLNKGGANFITHNAKKENNTIVFEKTLMYRFVPYVFIFSSLLTAWSVYSKKLYTGENKDFLWLTILASVFMFVGIVLVLRFRKPIVFDMNSGYFRRGKLRKKYLMDPFIEDKNCTKLSNIHGLQIISEHIRSNDSDSPSYYSYEFNLILNSRKRIHVVDHGNLNTLMNDVKLVSEFINVPIVQTE